MQILLENFETSQIIKKSTFIAVLCDIKDFEKTLTSLKSAHPHAKHFVWAWRKIGDFNQIEENQNDDKEPKGSAGPPVLSALRGADLINTACIVVRYFGGIKLGVGGLVRAYSSSANLAINEARLGIYELNELCVIFVNFSDISKFEHFLNTNSIKFEMKFGENGADFLINLTENKMQNLLAFCGSFKNKNFVFKTMPLFTKSLI